MLNVRDLGGYAARDGRTTRWRRLFRGAGLQRLAGTDAEVVRALGVRTVLDLRTRAELDAVGRFPSALLPADVHHLPMVASAWAPAATGDEASLDGYLLARYREMLVDGRRTIATAFALLARPESYPCAFYCAAGKDRTGVLAAIILAAIGVEDDEIVRDYALSAERVALIAARARAKASQAGAAPATGHPPELVGAPASTMRLLLASIAADHGSVAGYLASIGVDAPTVRAVADGLLEAR